VAAFERRRRRLDWRQLHAVDVDRIVRHTDIDSLEQAVDTIAFGDVEVCVRACFALRPPTERR
jgi:hypothetical protein